MVNYYYLMAQLPYLIYEQKPPMSSEGFKILAQYFMNEEDSRLMDFLSLDSHNIMLSAADIKPKDSCGFINAWREWERALRLNVAKERVIKLKKDNQQITDPPLFPMDASAAASKASDESTPLESEIVLDKARWSAIDAIAGNGNFLRDHVYAYYLKLLLLERRQLFNAELGFSEYKLLYASILENAQKNPGEHE